MSSARLPIRRGPAAYALLTSLGLIGASFGAWWTGHLPYAAYVAVTAPAYFVIAVCCHDAIHRAAHDDKRVNEWVGHVSTFIFGAHFPIFKRGHLQHHGHADQPDDIERLAYETTWQLPIRWLISNWMYYAIWDELKEDEKRVALRVLAIYPVLLALAPVPVLLGWLVPMQLATAAFSVLTVWLPHGPIKAWALEKAPAFTGYHAAHHARPAYPCTQYRALHLQRLAEVGDDALVVLGRTSARVPNGRTPTAAAA